jgi:hypothetical protein
MVSYELSSVKSINEKYKNEMNKNVAEIDRLTGEKYGTRVK